MRRIHADVEHIDHICHIDHILKVCRTHRYDHISLLHFCPGEVLQELVVRHAAKVLCLTGKFEWLADLFFPVKDKSPPRLDEEGF